MSTQHKLSEGYEADERSCKVSIGVIALPAGVSMEEGPQMDYDELVKFILRLIAVASYISPDPEATLARFNTSYEETNKLC